MKILFNAPNPALKGGPPTHLPWLEAELRKHLELVAFDYGRKSDNENLVQKVWGRFADLLHVRRLLVHAEPDIIHHNSAFDPRAILRDAPLAAMAKRYGVPLFIKIHGSLPEAFTTESRLVKRLRDQLLRDVTALGVLSHAEKDEFEREFPETRGKVYVVKNILKPDFYEVERNESAQPSVLFISRCIRRKGVFDFINAIPSVLAEVPTARFHIVGDGEDAAEVDRIIRDSHLDFCVERHAHCDNKQTSSYYSSTHVFAFPTHFPEGMPMVIAEALAAGVPIVTTRTRFSKSYMREGQHCLYSTHGDAEQLALHIVRLLKSPHMRNQMSAANRSLAQNFRAEAVTQEFLALYERIVYPKTARKSAVPNLHLVNNES